MMATVNATLFVLSFIGRRSFIVTYQDNLEGQVPVPISPMGSVVGRNNGPQATRSQLPSPVITIDIIKMN
jgi:hypothetical protein